MAQVTIYLEDKTLQHVKACAAEAKMSVSKWLAQIAESNLKKKSNDRSAFWEQIDNLRQGESDDDLDFLLDPSKRHAGLGQDMPREPFN